MRIASASRVISALFLVAGFDPLPVQAARECTRNLEPPSYPLVSHEPKGEFLLSAQGEFGGNAGVDRVLVIPIDSRRRKLVRVDANQAGRLQHVELFEFEPVSGYYGQSPAYGFGDVTGDGFDDVIDVRDSIVRLHRGHGDGTFSPVVTGPLTTQIRHDPPPVLADIDGDGVLELVTIGDLYATTLRAFRYTEDRGWISRIQAFLTFRPTRFLVGDFNGDGITDVGYVVAGGSQPIVIHLGDPELPLQTWWLDLAPAGVGVLAALDFEGDGVWELLAREHSSPERLARLDWDTTLLPRLREQWRVSLPSGTGRFMSVTHADTDPYADLIFSQRDPNGYQLGFLLQRGRSQGFDEVYRSRFDWRYAGTVDPDHDGVLDLLIAEPSIGFSWVNGTSNGSFDDGLLIRPAPESTERALAADLTHDQRLDLVMYFGQSAGSRRLETRVGLGGAEFATYRAGPEDRWFVLDRVVDLDGDGTRDLLARSTGAPHGVQTAKGFGDGSFALWVGSPTSELFASVDFGHANSDRWVDLLVPVFERNAEPSGYFADVYLGSESGFVRKDRAALSTWGHAPEFADVDGDGLDDLIQVEPEVTDHSTVTSSRVLWRRMLTDGQLAPPLPFSSDVFPMDIQIQAADLNGDRLADLLVTLLARPEPHTYRVMIGDGGAGNAPTTWEGERVDRYSIGQLLDIDGDQILDLVQSVSGRFSVQLGTGLGSFSNAGDHWLLGPRFVSGFAPTFGDLDGSGRSDLLSIWGLLGESKYVVSRAGGRVAASDTAAPVVELWPLPELRWEHNVPAWQGRWQLTGKAQDDCRSAVVDSVKLLLPALDTLEAIQFEPAEREAIEVYQATLDQRRTVLLRGPDQSAIRTRFDSMRANGIELPRAHSFVIDEWREPGTIELPGGGALLIYSVEFTGALPERVQSFSPLTGVEVELSAVDWIGKRTTMRDVVAAAKLRICTSNETPRHYVCEQ